MKAFLIVLCPVCVAGSGGATESQSGDVDVLLEDEDDDIPPYEAPGTPDKPLHIAIVGRPNVGKSTL